MRHLAYRRQENERPAAPARLWWVLLSSSPGVTEQEGHAAATCLHQKMLDTSRTSWAGCWRIHWVRGCTAYSFRALLAAAFRADLIRASTAVSQLSGPPLAFIAPPNATLSPSPATASKHWPQHICPALLGKQWTANGHGFLLKAASLQRTVQTCVSWHSHARPANLHQTLGQQWDLMTSCRW